MNFFARFSILPVGLCILLLQGCSPETRPQADPLVVPATPPQPVETTTTSEPPMLEEVEVEVVSEPELVNLLANASFEVWPASRPANWTGQGNLGQVSDAQEGEVAVRLGPDDGVWALLRQVIEVDESVVGKTLTFSFFAKTTPGIMGMSVGYMQDGKFVKVNRTSFAGDGEWKQVFISMTITGEMNLSSLCVEIYRDPAKDEDAFVDDASVTIQ